jgi:hypothetical protein
MYALPGQANPDTRELAKLIGLANAQSLMVLMQETAISNSDTQTPRQRRRAADDVRSAPSLAHSSRRARPTKNRASSRV